MALVAAILSFSGPQPRPLAAVRHRAPVLFDVGLALFEAQVATEAVVANQLTTQLTPLSGLVLYGAGLLTAVSPCCLSMLPLTTAVIAGLEQESDGLLKLRLPVAFALGLASSLAVAGVVAALTGRLYGQSPGILAEALPAVIAVGMGLNLLQAHREPTTQHLPRLSTASATAPPSAASQVLPFSFPSVVPRADRLNLPPMGKAFAFGAASALASSPCASPVCAAAAFHPTSPPARQRGATPALTPPSPPHPRARLVSILGFVSQSQDPALGAVLLLCYSLGSTSLVLLAGVLTGTTVGPNGPLKSVSQWVSPATGAALLTYGTYAGLGLAFP
jgi:cytochrome c-type biogenesis protein